MNASINWIHICLGNYLGPFGCIALPTAIWQNFCKRKQNESIFPLRHYDMETVSMLLAFVRGINWLPAAVRVLVTQTLMFSLVSALAAGLFASKQLGIFCSKLFFDIVPYICKVSPMQWIFSQHCGYWCPGAFAPEHQQLLQCCWLRIHTFPFVYGLRINLLPAFTFGTTIWKQDFFWYFWLSGCHLWLLQCFQFTRAFEHAWRR